MPTKPTVDRLRSSRHSQPCLPGQEVRSFRPSALRRILGTRRSRGKTASPYGAHRPSFSLLSLFLNVSMQTITLPNNIHIDKGNKIYDGVFSQSLDFRIEMDYDAAMQFIRRIGGYNQFEPEDVINALECIDRLLPRAYFNEGNGNNGMRRYKLSVGGK